MVNVLIVYAHAEKTSFNASLLEVAVDTLQGQGHKVTVSDLYAMKFNPVATRDDFKEPLKDSTEFKYGAESAKAYQDGRLAGDVIEEQKKVSEADLIIFQYPMHWSNVPAILKGWFDRVFIPVYSFDIDEFYDNARFRGKKAMLSFTTGGPEGWWTGHSPNGDIEVVLWPIQNGILRFVGFDVLSPNICYGIDFSTEADFAAMLESYKVRLKSITNEKPLPFLPMSHFRPIDPQCPMQGFVLKDDVIAKECPDEQYGYSVGQHLGRKIPPGSMVKRPQEQNGGLTD